MSYRAQHTILARTPLLRKDGFHPAVTDLRIVGAQLALASVAQVRVPRMAVCGGRCGAENGMVHPLSALAAGLGNQRQKKSFCRPVALASCTGALQQNVSIERHFSRIFPAFPRSLASVLIPRPAALAVLLRLTPPFGFRFSENLFGHFRKDRGKKRFPEPSENAPLGTRERGTLASLRARVSRGNFGQIQTGEKQ